MSEADLHRKLAPGRRFELRTLRLTDRCCPFRNGALNSLSAAECRHVSRFTTDVAAMGRPLSRRQAATSGHIDRGMEPEGGRDGAAGLSDANALGQAGIRGLATS